MQLTNTTWFFPKEHKLPTPDQAVGPELEPEINNIDTAKVQPEQKRPCCGGGQVK